MPVNLQTAVSGSNVRSKRLLLLASFAIIYVVWGSTYLAIRYAVETIPPLITAGVPLDCWLRAIRMGLVSWLSTDQTRLVRHCRPWIPVLLHQSRFTPLGRAGGALRTGRSPGRY